MRRLLALLAITVLFGCEEQAAPEGETGAAPTGEAAAPTAPVAPTATEEKVIAVGTITLKRAPNEEKKVEDEKGKKVPNWLATLYRGEELDKLGVEGDWIKARTSTDAEGWVKADKVVKAADITQATLASEAKVFKRPSAMTLDAKKTIPAGSILFILKQKDEFSQVNSPRSEYGSEELWVKTDNLLTDSKEVEAAKLITRIRFLKEKNDETADELVKMVMSDYSSSKLLPLIQLPPDEAEPAEGEGAGDGSAGDMPDGPSDDNSAAAEEG